MTDGVELGRRLASFAIAHARRRGLATHVEVRFVEQRRESLFLRDGRVDELSSQSTRGFGVRVLAGGWGFSCTPTMTEEALLRTVDRATEIAVAAGKVGREPIAFPAREAERGTYETKLALDPFTVPLERKIADLEAAVRALATSPKVASAEAWMEWSEVRKLLVTSEGTDVAQRIVFGGAGMSCVAKGTDGRTQRRSYPAARGSELSQGGYESVAALRMTENAERVRDEAIALTEAPPCPSGRRTLIVEASQLALQIHESTGHPTELDRAMGSEISLAGGSFLQPSMLGTFVYGSSLVDLTCDSIADGGLGTFGWDDEGTRAASTHLVRGGVFVDYLSSRETAARLGRASTGAMRADSWNRPAIVRMVNISLAPREGSLEELIADTDDGILVATNKSWSIDDLRRDFQFGCEAAWEIKKGKRTRMLRDPFYADRTPEFWGGCDAICGSEEWRMWGIATCGKGDPIQLLGVGHGAAPARFRDVDVGSA
jgi:TldD protein